MEVWLVSITRDVERMTRTAQDIADAQRDSYEALADNFAAFQRRGVRLAQGGLEVLRLPESNARAAQEGWAKGVRVLDLQQRNARVAQNWRSGRGGVLRE